MNSLSSWPSLLLFLPRHKWSGNFSFFIRHICMMLMCGGGGNVTWDGTMMGVRKLWLSFRSHDDDHGDDDYYGGSQPQNPTSTLLGNGIIFTFTMSPCSQAAWVSSCFCGNLNPNCSHLSVKCCFYCVQSSWQWYFYEMLRNCKWVENQFYAIYSLGLF